MFAYHELLRHVLEHGRRAPTRAALKSTGRKIDALSVFGHQFRHDLAAGFPLLTTKRVSFHNVIHELVWFLRGETSIKYLTDHDVHIWDEWADDRGNLGPVYGRQWRAFLGIDSATGRADVVDQVAGVLRDIAAVRDDPEHPARRRLIVTAWNPPQVKYMGLPPCHTLYQFGVADGRLSCHLFARSIDAFLGLPYNLASYAALTHLFAALADLRPGALVISFSDLHIYSNHLDQVREQLGREPRPLPRLHVRPPASIDGVSAGDFRLHDYEHHPALKAEVAV